MEMTNLYIFLCCTKSIIGQLHVYPIIQKREFHMSNLDNLENILKIVI